MGGGGMNDKELITLLIIGFLAGAIMGLILSTEYYQQRAIKAQVAYYDANTSDFKFKGE
jgi:hypothetical protein